jgi:hypothetical protein
MTNISFTGLLNNVSSTAYCMKLHLNGGRKKKEERKKKKRKCQTLNQERNSGHPEYRNDSLIFSFFYIVKNVVLATKAW